MLTKTEVREHFRRLTRTWKPVPGYPLLRRPTSKIGISELAPPGILDTDEGYEFWMSEFPWGLTQEDFLHLSWYGLPGLSSSYTISTIRLSETECLYVEYSDWDADYYSALAFGMSEDLYAADREFLQALFERNGRTFGTGVIGSPPSSVSIGFPVPPDFLIGLFVNLFDAADAWEGLREDFPEVWENGEDMIDYSDEDIDPDEEIDERPEEKEKQLRYPGGQPSFMNMSDGAMLWVNPEECARKNVLLYWESVRAKWRMARKYLAQVT